jgi:hypothetical protein
MFEYLLGGLLLWSVPAHGSPADLASAQSKGTPCVTANGHVEVSQQVSASKGSILVHVAFRNDSSESVLIMEGAWGIAPRGGSGDRDSLFEPEFAVRSEGKQIRYIGPEVKRLPYTRENFVEFKPGDTSAWTAQIARDYDFLPGRHEYEVAFIHLEFDERTGQIVSKAAQPTRFWYTR